jgi:hypothetical protein
MCALGNIVPGLPQYCDGVAYRDPCQADASAGRDGAHVRQRGCQQSHARVCLPLRPPGRALCRGFHVASLPGIEPRNHNLRCALQNLKWPSTMLLEELLLRVHIPSLASAQPRNHNLRCVLHIVRCPGWFLGVPLDQPDLPGVMQGFLCTF